MDLFAGFLAFFEVMRNKHQLIFYAHLVRVLMLKQYGKNVSKPFAYRAFLMFPLLGREAFWNKRLILSHTYLDNSLFL